MKLGRISAICADFEEILDGFFGEFPIQLKNCEESVGSVEREWLPREKGWKWRMWVKDTVSCHVGGIFFFTSNENVDLLTFLSFCFSSLFHFFFQDYSLNFNENVKESWKKFAVIGESTRKDSWGFLRILGEESW